MLYTVPLQDVEVGTWCILGARSVEFPISHGNTINSVIYAWKILQVDQLLQFVILDNLISENIATFVLRY
jgi:hypothetical protein